MMAEAATCPACGKPVEASSLGGFCPACLMAQGLEGTDPGEATTKAATPEWTVESETIGPYRLLRKIGEGGMGEVWLAEQTKPVRRKVALKVIKEGLDTKQVVARFEAERQALALMSHPAIAKVFDAGATPGGRPYFVMEYVQGLPIHEHCDRHRLTTKQRLALFREVCEGVQHAHQKAVIHRDLKPSNVLVTIQDDRPAPKIIDFGVAKATAQRLTEQTLHTQVGMMVGTLAYMSPEQADLTEQDIDTRADVYSLGVMLYELLIGVLPFDFKELQRAGYEAMVRKIREDDPPRPSARLSTLGEHSTESARLRGTVPTTLRRELTGDLDWITMKALEKDRTRRYGSPNELAADLARHLSHEPVLAGPPSAAYRARKFVRRNRLAVSFAAMVALLLVGFAATMAVQAQRIARERDRANREADTANRVSQFMTRLFAIPDPGESRGNEVTAREILDQGAKQITRGLKDEASIRARLLATMGVTYRNLGLLDDAQRLFEEALRIQEGQLDRDEKGLGRILMDVGWVDYERFHRSGNPRNLERAIDYLTRVVEVWETILSPDDPDLATARTFLGFALMRAGESDRAEALAREARRVFQLSETPGWPAASNAILLSGILENRGDVEAAFEFTDYSVKVFERVTERGEYWPPLIDPFYNAAYTYRIAGRVEKAVELFQRSRDRCEELYGPEHLKVAEAHWEIGRTYRDHGRLEDARRSLEQAIAIHELPLAMGALSQTLLRLGDIQGAYEYRSRVMQARESDPGYAGSPLLLSGRLQLAHLLMRLDRPEEALPHYRGALDLAASGVDVGCPGQAVADVYRELAVLVAETGALEDAHRLFEVALAGAQACSIVKQRPVLGATVHRDHAALLRRMGRNAEAAEHEARAAELAAESTGIQP